MWARSPPVPHVSNAGAKVFDSLRRARSHRPGQADDLGGALPFHPQADEEAGDLRRLGAAFHDLLHGGRRFVHGEVLTAVQFFE